LLAFEDLGQLGLLGIAALHRLAELFNASREALGISFFAVGTANLLQPVRREMPSCR